MEGSPEEPAALTKGGRTKRKLTRRSAIHQPQQGQQGEIVSHVVVIRVPVEQDFARLGVQHIHRNVVPHVVVQIPEQDGQVIGFAGQFGVGVVGNDSKVSVHSGYFLSF